MPILALLWQYRKYVAILIALLAIGIAILRYGHSRYAAGEAAREAFWQPKFQAAEIARQQAEIRTKALESEATTISANIEARHAETIKQLETRAAGAEQSLSASLRHLARCASGSQLSPVPNATSIPDGAAPSDARIDGAARRIAATGTHCERDAATLAELQDWVRQQQALNP